METINVFMRLDAYCAAPNVRMSYRRRQIFDSKFPAGLSKTERLAAVSSVRFVGSSHLFFTLPRIFVREIAP